MTWFKRQRVIIQAVLITAILGGIIAGIFVVLAPIVSEITQGWFDDSDLELVDASLEEAEEATTLDIKVRNTGEKVAYLKEADFNVEKVWELRSPVVPDPAPVSRNYDVALSPNGAPYTRTERLSQSIEPNKVDRFTFTLSLNDRASLEAENIQYVFLITVDLVYAADDKVISSDNLLFVRRPAFDEPRKYFFPNANPNDPDEQWFANIHADNEQVLDEVRAIEGIKSESLKQLIHYTSQED